MGMSGDRLFIHGEKEMQLLQKPAAGEYTPYTIAYIDLVPDDGMVLDHLRDNPQ